MATLTVTNTNNSGTGSLRDAVSRAVAGDVIAFASTLANKTITLSTGQITLSKAITIDGTAAPNLTISGNNSSRVFSVAYKNSASFKNLTIANGRTTDRGGGIEVIDYGSISVTNCRFNNNAAGIGGAIQVGYGGKATVTNSQFNNNDGTLAKSGYSSGAISTYGSGVLTVKSSQFIGNRGINGGAIYNLLGGVTVENSVFLNNSSAGGTGGGAVFVDGGNPVGPGSTVGGTIAIRNSWFQGNQTKGEGGALFLYGYGPDKIILENSTVIGNTALADANGVARGGGLRSTTNLTVNNVTFANNTADKQGGALWLDGKLPVSIVNSTFSSNRANQDAGGAMFLNSSSTATISIKNSTIVKNYAGRASGALWMNSSTQPVTLSNSIVAFNTATDQTQNQVGYQPRDGGGNIEYPAPVYGARRVAAGSRIVDPMIGALQNVGGVYVHPLLSGSPAINTGVTGAPTIDERGATRDTKPDVGAFEFGVTSPLASAFRINDVSLTEGNSGLKSAVFTVTRSGSTSRLATVNYATANGTALAGQDYNSTSGRLSFFPGETTKTINVQVIGDTSLESNETFFVNLSSVTNAGISDTQGLGTILNDDGTTLTTASTTLTAASTTQTTQTLSPTNGASGGWFSKTLLPTSSNQATATRTPELTTAAPPSLWQRISGTLS